MSENILDTISKTQIDLERLFYLQRSLDNNAIKQDDKKDRNLSSDVKNK